jgi:ribose-phosphate pyrophosphokinase
MIQLLAMPGSEALAEEIARANHWRSGQLEVRSFPDQETYLRIHSAVDGQDVVLVGKLTPPDPAFLPTVFAVRTLRKLGAKRVGLVAPYLPYMRQDKAFNEGEAVSSRIFAALLGRELDLLVTVDPHLHRFSRLDAIYRCPAIVLTASPLIGDWIRENVSSPLILGPDSESEQWARRIADVAGAPWATLVKERRGDMDVALTLPPLDTHRGRTPVLVDDIISSGGTMLAAAEILARAGFPAPRCVAVHGLFEDDTSLKLETVMRTLVTTDTVPNAFASIRVAPLIAAALASCTSRDPQSPELLEERLAAAPKLQPEG